MIRPTDMPLHHDVRVAVRRLVSRPGSTLVCLLTLALGIGAATAVFSVVDQTVLRPAPFPYADRLVDVLHIHSVSKGGGNSLTPQKVLGWQAQRSLFERLEAYAPQQVDLTGTAEPERVSGWLVSLGLFSMLDARPQIGRAFENGDGTPGSERVVIISNGLWQRRFGGDADVLGRRITLNDLDYTVIGVMARRFRLMSADESFWLPVALEAFATDTRFPGYGIGRLAPGVTQDGAQKLADAIAERMNRETPIPTTWGLGLRRKQVARVDETTRTALLVLLGAVGFVLLITCANVANLFLSQAPMREREMAIRSALGARRSRLVRSVLAESLLLAAAGGGLGILLARWGVDAILAAAPAGLVSRSTVPIEVDARVLAVAAALTILTGLVFGLFPALVGSRPNMEATLRNARRAAMKRPYGRVPGSLVVLEVAFAVVLLVGAALMTRTLMNLNAIDPGFDPNGLVAMHVALPSDRYPTPAARAAFFDAVGEKLQGVAGITDVAVSQGTPPSIGGISFGRPEIEGTGTPDRETMVIPNGTVSASYFSALRIPLLAGRNFRTNEPEDTVVVSKAFADRYWPGGDAVGRRFRMFSNGPWCTIVGVVGSVQASAGSDTRTLLQFYYPRAVRAAAPQVPAAVPPRAAAMPRRSYAYQQLIVRAANPSEAIARVKEQIWAVDPNQPIERIALVNDTYAEMFAKQRFVLALMGAFAALALVLTAAGIFSVLSQAVAQRTREIGIRMALGARPRDVMRLILSRGMLLTSAGVLLGAAAAVVLAKTLGALLYGVSATDPASFGVVAVVLIAVAFVACWLPTRAAMRVHPAVALRTE